MRFLKQGMVGLSTDQSVYLSIHPPIYIYVCTESLWKSKQENGSWLPQEKGNWETELAMAVIFIVHFFVLFEFLTMYTTNYPFKKVKWKNGQVIGSMHRNEIWPVKQLNCHLDNICWINEWNGATFFSQVSICMFLISWTEGRLSDKNVNQKVNP